MNLSRSRLYRETLNAAMRFHSRRLWERFEYPHSFAVSVPGEEHPMLASIMGQGEQEFGLCLTRGKDAFRGMMAILESDAFNDDLVDVCPFMGFSMTRFEEVPPPGRKFLNTAKFRPGPGSIVPLFLAKEPGKHVREITRSEATKLLYALNGILKALDEGVLEPERLQEGRDVLTLTVDGDPMWPDVSVGFRSYEGSSASKVVALPVFPPDLKGLPRLSERWLIGFPVLPLAIEKDEREIRMLVIVEEASELILQGESLLGGGVEEAAEAVFKAFRGDNFLDEKGLPKEVVISSRLLFERLSPVLDSLGVRCTYQQEIPRVDGAVDYVLSGMTEDAAGPDGLDYAPLAVPDADDLQGWKACESQLFNRAVGGRIACLDFPDRAVARYFGDLEAGEYFFSDPDDIFPSLAFAEWFWLDYLATRRSKTLAQKMLAGELPESERLLLEARMMATPSIYRIQSVRKGESLCLLDIVFGKELVAHDAHLSETAPVDWCLPARVFAAGGFHFVSPMGPAIPPLEIVPAVEFLQEHGMKLTREGIAHDSHVFGRLWDWLEERRESAGGPEVRNSDGDKMCFHTATYTVKDEMRARAAIAARDDIEDEEQDGEFVWIRETKGRERKEGFGEVICLGRLWFLGEALLVEVNSAERFEKARGWLDAIPGIEFRKVRVRTLEEMMESDVPPDDRIGDEDRVPMTPELVSRVGQMMHRYCMEWLDTPLPIFDGRTPRQMCETAAGRRKVAILIRSMPRPMGPAGPDVDIPREEMLRALGLDDE